MQKDLAKYTNGMKEKAISVQTSSGPSMGDPRGPAPKPRLPDTKRMVSTAGGSKDPKDPPNQKSGLLKALLSMGAIRPSLFILSKFPWLVASHPELADIFLQMIRVSLSPIYEPLSFASRAVSAKSQPHTGRIIIESGHAPKILAKKKLLVVQAPVPPGNNFTDFVYFYPAWDRTVPICTTRAEISNVIEPLMRFVGVNAYRDVGLLTRLCRIGKAELTQVSLVRIETIVFS